MAARATAIAKRRRKGSPPGSFGYGIQKRITVPEHQRWETYDVLCDLHSALGRPVARAELAAALGKNPDEVFPHSLVNARFAIRRTIPDTAEMGFVPADLSATRLDKALARLEQLPDGTYRYFVGTGSERQEKTLRVDRHLRSRIRKTAARLQAHLALPNLRGVTSDQLPRLHRAVYDLEMERSLVPQRLWESQSPQANGPARRP